MKDKETNTSSEKLMAVHESAVQQMDDIQRVMYTERMQCLEDRRFYSIAGAQWEGPLREQFENKPKFEVNKVHLGVVRIINEFRNNKIGVSFVSKDGTDRTDLADKCASLFRADEQDSDAEEAYNNAFEEAVGGGFGAFRLCNEYEDEEDEESEHQRIRIQPIYDADSTVFFDLNSKKQDKSDADYAFILTSITTEKYKELYGGDPVSVDKNVTNAYFDWFNDDHVFIAEYYKVEHKRDKVVFFVGVMGEEEKLKESEIKEYPEKEQTLLSRGFKRDREKKIKVRRIHKYIMSGQEILEDCGLIAGKNIPIVPVYGKRWFIDGIERCMGHVRLCKDAQRLKNMQLSKLGEISALSAVEKPILTPEQIVGHEAMWSSDNIKNYPFLMINSLTGMDGNPIATGPTAYTKPAQVPQALAALLQQTEVDLQDILGNQGGGEQIESNLSGKAVELIQTRLDMQSFIYISNFSLAQKRAGEIWLSMASEIYVEEERKMKAIGESGEITSVEIARPVMNDDNEIEFEADLSKAKFDVAVDVGPTSSSKKSAMVRTVTEMLPLTQDPETQTVLMSLAMLNTEGEGMGEVHDFFRNKLLRMGVLKPTEEEAQQLQEEAQNQQPDANTIYLQASAEKEQALAGKAQVDSLLTEAKVKQTIASTAATLASIDRDDRSLTVQETTAQSRNMGENQKGNS